MNFGVIVTNRALPYSPLPGVPFWSGQSPPAFGLPARLYLQVSRSESSWDASQWYRESPVTMVSDPPRLLYYGGRCFSRGHIQQKQVYLYCGRSSKLGKACFTPL